MSYQLIVIGGGLATARAVKAYRESGAEGSALIVSQDTAIPYHRPPLSKRYLRGEQEKEETFVEPADFYREHEVELRLDQTVSAVHPDSREVELEGGSRVAYEQLLIATGASPRPLDIPGAQLENVFTLRTLADSTTIGEQAARARRAVVIGAGFIGMEVTASLRTLGLDVTLVHRGTGLFEGLDSPELSRYLVDQYRERGVQVVLEDEAQEFKGDDRVREVVTASGQNFGADLVVIGIGVTPDVEFLTSSGLEIDDGIVVNERFETGVDGIFAAGDVARFYDSLFDRHRRIEHWSNANYQGTEVGKILAGDGSGYDRVSSFFSEVFGLVVKVFGDSKGHSELAIRGSFEERDALGLYLDGDRLVAALSIGQSEETEAAVTELIGRRATVTDRASFADPDIALESSFG